MMGPVGMHATVNTGGLTNGFSGVTDLFTAPLKMAIGVGQGIADVSHRTASTLLNAPLHFVNGALISGGGAAGNHRVGARVGISGNRNAPTRVGASFRVGSRNKRRVVFQGNQNSKRQGNQNRQGSSNRQGNLSRQGNSQKTRSSNMSKVNIQMDRKRRKDVERSEKAEKNLRKMKKLGTKNMELQKELKQQRGDHEWELEQQALEHQGQLQHAYRSKMQMGNEYHHESNGNGFEHQDDEKMEHDRPLKGQYGYQHFDEQNVREIHEINDDKDEGYYTDDGGKHKGKHYGKITGGASRREDYDNDYDDDFSHGSNQQSYSEHTEYSTSSYPNVKSSEKFDPEILSDKELAEIVSQTISNGALSRNLK